METKNGDDAMVEGILSLWKISSQGQIQKDKEISFEYNMAFKDTKDGKMMLTLSHDKKIITLGMQNDDYSQGLTLLAWNSKTLKSVPFPLLL